MLSFGNDFWPSHGSGKFKLTFWSLSGVVNSFWRIADQSFADDFWHARSEKRKNAFFKMQKKRILEHWSQSVPSTFLEPHIVSILSNTDNILCSVHKFIQNLHHWQTSTIFYSNGSVSQPSTDHSIVFASWCTHVHHLHVRRWSLANVNLPTNGISMASAIFAELTNTQTDHRPRHFKTLLDDAGYKRGTVFGEPRFKLKVKVNTMKNCTWSTQPIT